MKFHARGKNGKKKIEILNLRVRCTINWIAWIEEKKHNEKRKNARNSMNQLKLKQWHLIHSK